jgi:arylsulfatase A-like enzyme/Flp pilus assembly protein TadD
VFIRGFRGVVIAAAVAAVSAAAWWRLAPRRVAPGELNVIVLTLDTTRADRLGCYGAANAATPNLDRLAEEGVLFERAIAPVPLTLPAHSSIFTGTLPPAHGVRDNGGYVLDPKQETLAELLHGRGWRTGAFVGAFVLDSKWGLDQGFERYVDNFELSKYKTLSLGDIDRPASDVVDAALPWLDEHASQRFFAWLHFYDPHSPYTPPEPFRSAFAERPYAGEIAYVDFQIARVLQWLDSRRLADRTIVVAMADHGESLNEHGEGTHGLFVYDATVHVPLIVRAPSLGLRGRRVRSVVRAHDVLPTVLELVGLPAAAGAQGRSLVPLMNGAAEDLNLEAYSESYYARNHYGWSELKALRAGRYKYIDAPRAELYDLERDPGETTNLYDERRTLAGQMAAALARIETESGGAAAAAPAAVDPETRERLAALGYIGSFVDVKPREGERLPDPKDKIEIFNLMLAAQETVGKESGEGPIERLKRVLAQDPKIIDAWIMLGNEYFRRREPATALLQYRKALELNPDYDLATINLANAYRELGDYDAAILGYERYLERDPRNAYVRYQLGELFSDTGQLDRAEAAFRQALTDDQRVASARNALGVVAFSRGDLDGAEREIRAALAQRSDVRLAHFNLALVAERRRDFKTAIEEYRREMELHAGSFKAAFNLARLYEQLGDAARYEALLRESIELNPRFAEGHFFLAKLYLDRGRDLDGAAGLARRGLDVGPRSRLAPLGHYVLADVYSRQGRHADAAREAARGRQLESRLASPRPPITRLPDRSPDKSPDRPIPR